MKATSREHLMTGEKGKKVLRGCHSKIVKAKCLQMFIYLKSYYANRELGKQFERGLGGHE